MIRGFSWRKNFFTSWRLSETIFSFSVTEKIRDTFCLLVSNMTFFSISYMGCHPSHWLSYFSEGFKPPTSFPSKGLEEISSPTTFVDRRYTHSSVYELASQVAFPNSLNKCVKPFSEILDEKRVQSRSYLEKRRYRSFKASGVRTGDSLVNGE